MGPYAVNEKGSMLEILGIGYHVLCLRRILMYQKRVLLEVSLGFRVLYHA
jgi:hypothetical protein